MSSFVINITYNCNAVTCFTSFIFVINIADFSGVIGFISVVTGFSNVICFVGITGFIYVIWFVSVTGFTGIVLLVLLVSVLTVLLVICFVGFPGFIGVTGFIGATGFIGVALLVLL